MKFLNYISLLLIIVFCAAGGVANAQVGDEDEYGYEDPGYDDGTTWNDDNYNWSNDGSGYGGAYEDIYDIVDDILTNGLANFDDGYTHIEFDEDGGITSYNEYSWEEIDNDPSLVPDYVWDALNEIQDYVDQANNYYQAALDEYNNVGTEVLDIYTYMDNHYSQYGYQFRIQGDYVLVFDQENPTEDGSPNYVIHRTDKLPFPEITPPGGYASDPLADMPTPEPDYPPFPNEPYDPMDPDWQQWYADYQSGVGSGNNNNNNDPPKPCATKVEFKEDVPNKYGWDDRTQWGYNDPNHADGYAWKSVEMGVPDLVKARVTAPENYSTVYFKVTPADKLTAWSPTKAPSSAFNFTFTTITFPDSELRKEIEVQANCNSADGNLISKLKIATYPRRKLKVGVRLINSKAISSTGYTGYQSTDLNLGDIETYLNTIYKQGVVEWVVKRLPPMDAQFDFDQDYMVDDVYKTNGDISDELTTIMNQCIDPEMDVTLFLVNNNTTPTTGGISPTPGPFSFVFVNTTPNPLNTVAHELGHSGCGFNHDWQLDPENVMYNTHSPERTKFRKDQWDRMHP